MAKNIDVSALSLNAKETQDFAKFVVEQVFSRPELTSLNRVITGVTMKEQITFASQLGLTGVKGDGTCTRKSSGAKSTMTQKFWEPAGIEETLINCQAEINDLFKAYYDKIGTYGQNYDITGTDEELFIAALVSESINATIDRAIWLADTDVAEADGSTPGLIEAGNVQAFDYFDGIWKQIFTGVTATDIARYTVAENTPEGSPAAIADLTAERALAILKATYSQADSRLKTSKDGQFYVSGEVFEKYVDYLESKGSVYDISILEGGLQSVAYKGKKVINMANIWDVNLNYFVNNTAEELAYLPYRVVFTTPANIPVGTLNEDDFNSLESWFEKKERANYTGYGFSLDAKVLEEYMISVAY